MSSYDVWFEYDAFVRFLLYYPDDSERKKIEKKIDKICQNVFSEGFSPEIEHYDDTAEGITRAIITTDSYEEKESISRKIDELSSRVMECVSTYLHKSGNNDTYAIFSYIVRKSEFTSNADGYVSVVKSDSLVYVDDSLYKCKKASLFKTGDVTIPELGTEANVKSALNNCRKNGQPVLFTINEAEAKKRSSSRSNAKSKSDPAPKDEFTYGQRKKAKCDGYTVYIPDGFELDTDSTDREFVAYKFFGSSKNKGPEQAGIRFYSSVLIPFPAGSTLSETSKSANQLYETAMLPGIKIMAKAMGVKGAKVTDISSDRNAGSMISLNSEPLFFHYPAIVTSSGLQQFRVDINTEDLKISYKESFDIAKKLMDKIITGVDYDDVDSSKNSEKALFGSISYDDSIESDEEVDNSSNYSVDELILSAEKGNHDAMTKLADALLNGDDDLGIAQDAEESVQWRSRLAEDGDPDAMYNVGLHYAKGLGIERDFEKAVSWMNKASSSGNPEAGKEAERLRALSSAYDMAKQGDAQSQADLAIGMMELGETLNHAGEKDDYKEGIKWAKKAVSNDNADGYYILALAYHHGRGVKPNMEKAIEYFRQGADMGSASCRYALGMLFLSGEGIRKNSRKGFELIQSSAEQGNVDAIRRLGMCYQHGEGTEVDREKAIELYEKVLEVSDDHELEIQVITLKMAGGLPELSDSFSLTFDNDNKYETEDLKIAIPDEFKYVGKEKKFKMYLPGEKGLSDAQKILKIIDIESTSKNYDEIPRSDIILTCMTNSLYDYLDDYKTYALSMGVKEFHLDNIYASAAWILYSEKISFVTEVVLKNSIYTFEYAENGENVNPIAAMNNLCSILKQMKPKSKYFVRKAIDSPAFFKTINDKSIIKWKEYIESSVNLSEVALNSKVELFDTRIKVGTDLKKGQLKDLLQMSCENCVQEINQIYVEMLNALQKLTDVPTDVYLMVVNAALSMDYEYQVSCDCSGSRFEIPTDAESIIDSINNLDRYKSIKAEQAAILEEKKRLRIASRINPKLKDFESEIIPMPSECQKMIDSALDKLKNGRKADAKKASENMIKAYPDIAEAIWTNMLINVGAKDDEDLRSKGDNVNLAAQNSIFKAIGNGSPDFGLEKIKVIYSFAEDVQKSILSSFIDSMLVWDFDEREEMLNELIERSGNKKRYDVIERVLLFLKLPEESIKFVELCDKYYLSSRSEDIRNAGYNLLNSNGLGWGAQIYSSGEIPDDVKYRVEQVYYSVIIQEANALFDSGDYKEAQDKYREALENEPNNGWILYCLSKCEAALNNTGYAVCLWESQGFKDYLEKGDGTSVETVLQELSDENNDRSIKSAMNKYASMITEKEQQIEENNKKKEEVNKKKPVLPKSISDKMFPVLLMTIIFIPFGFLVDKVIGYLALSATPIEIIIWIVAGIAKSVSTKHALKEFERVKNENLKRLDNEIKDIQSSIDSIKADYSKLLRILRTIAKKNVDPSRVMKLSFKEGKEWGGYGITVKIPDGFAIEKSEYDHFQSWLSVLCTSELDDEGADIKFYSDGADESYRQSQASAPKSYDEARAEVYCFTAGDRDTKLKKLNPITTELDYEKNGIFGKIFSIDTHGVYEHYIAIITKYGYQYLRVDISQRNVKISMNESIEYVKALCSESSTYGLRVVTRTRSRTDSYYFSGDAESKSCDERVARLLADKGSDNIGEAEFIAACIASGVDPSSIEQRDLDYIQHLLNKWT